MAKRIIRLTESDLHRVVKESVQRVILEYQETQNDNYMQRSMDNGGPDKVLEQFLGKQNTYYGAIARMAAQNNHSYTDVLKDLQKRINSYMDDGRFGTNKEVLDVIGKFCTLLAYMNGAYEAAISRLRKKGLREDMLREWWNPFAGITYKNTNKYGVKQKIGKDKRGQWMKDLQGELRQMLEWKYLHGPKTVAATEAFIEFLEVEKRGILPFIPLKKMAVALTGLMLLGNVLNAYAPNVQENPRVQPQTQQVSQQQQQTQTIYFQIDSAELTPGAIQKLQQISQKGGSFEIIVHESQNSSGRDASYERNGKLIQARIDAVKNALGQNVKIVSATRGANTKMPCIMINPV